MIITEVGKQCCSPKDHGTRCAIGLIAYIEHKLDLTRPDEITEKTRIKRYNRTLKYSNGLELQSFNDLYSYMGILVICQGETLGEDFAQRVDR